MIVRTLTVILLTATLAAVVSTLALLNYARISCHWKWPSQDSFVRMVVMADPQMEGDAKIKRLGKRAHVDLAFNDAYMHHIYRSMMSPTWSPLYSFWSLISPTLDSVRLPRHDTNSIEENSVSSWFRPPTIPTQVVILGDLFSSQWIDNAEFDVRLKRYQTIFTDPLETMSFTFPFVQFADGTKMPEMINITGNHDIGYGYDISQERIVRWEEAFGKSNFVTSTKIIVPSTTSSSLSKIKSVQEKTLHFVVLNTMLIDGPSADENLRNQTWEFLQEASKIKDKNPNDKIVLLTHIPFHKEKGICVDPPDIHVHWDNTIIEQTMLTPNTTNWILDNLRPDFVLNGHDHEGCDTLHVSTSLSTSDSASDSNTSPLSWTAYSTATFSTASIDKNTKVVREITQRSMMAEFGGYSGLFEIRVNPDYHHQGSEKKNEDDDDYLEFSYQSCAFYKDLFVWIVIVTDLIVATAWTLVGSIWAVLYFVRHASSSRTAQKTISPKEKIL